MKRRIPVNGYNRTINQTSTFRSKINSRKNHFEMATYISDTPGRETGLGLSYDVVKVHGGEIKVNTVEGEFTGFVIQLPVSA